MFGKRIKKEYLKELKGVVDAEAREKYKLAHVKGNTALVPNAKKWIKTQEGIVKVLENARQSYVLQKLAEAGVPEGQAVNIDISTGRIKYVNKDD